ncbi:MAG: hypothetical protein Q9190_008107, partial [Brigantiaea leucoxantha]
MPPRRGQAASSHDTEEWENTHIDESMDMNSMIQENTHTEESMDINSLMQEYTHTDESMDMISIEQQNTQTEESRDMNSIEQENTHTEESMDMNSMMQALMTRLASMEQRYEARITALESRSSTAKQRERDPYSVEEPGTTPNPTPTIGPATTQAANLMSQAASQITADVRGRPEEVGYFDGNPLDVKPFTDRLIDIAATKGPKISQQNLITGLFGEAREWYDQELSN